MRIYTLTGKSGTGKSYHAMEIAKEKSIRAIIDDGLFIYDNKVIAGVSAKRSETKMGAIRIAIFENDEMRDKVSSAINEKNLDSILILGTSDEMTDRITARLGLKQDELIRIHIEDITSEEEREIAHEQRDKMGKHAIPAPALQLKHNFAGYFLDPLRLIRGKDQGMAAERTVVRPSYSYLGNYIVNERAINDIIHLVCRETEGIYKVVYISHLKSSQEQYELQIAIKVRHGYSVWDCAEIFQKRVQEMIEKMTAFNVVTVNVEVRGIS